MTVRPEQAPQSDAPIEAPHESGSFFQHAIPAVTLGAAALYATGMLITNEYLFSLGFTDFNLIRPKCIITGTWAMLLMLACCGPAISFHNFKEGKITKWRLFEELWVGYVVAAGLGMMFLSVLVSHWSVRVAGGYLLLPLALALAPLLHFVLTETLYRGRAKPSYTRHSPVLATMLLSPIVATIIIAAFIYPEVHSVLGGGRPRPAKIVLTAEGVGLWKQISGTLLNGHEAVATDLEIIYENETQTVVRLKHFNAQTGAVAILDKKAVLAVLPEKPPLP